jgi:hypothetical protein
MSPSQSANAQQGKYIIVRLMRLNNLEEKYDIANLS